MVKAKVAKGRKRILKGVGSSSSDSDFSVDESNSNTRKPTPKVNRMTCDVSTTRDHLYITSHNFDPLFTLNRHTHYTIILCLSLPPFRVWCNI